MPIREYIRKRIEALTQQIRLEVKGFEVHAGAGVWDEAAEVLRKAKRIENLRGAMGELERLSEGIEKGELAA